MASNMDGPGDLSPVAGHKVDPIPVDWLQRDLILYAYSVGVRPEQSEGLKFLYEKHGAYSPLPFYPLVLALKQDYRDVNDFAKVTGGRKDIPGIPPKADLRKVVHGEQSIEVIKPIPKVSGEGWTLDRTYLGAYDKGSGLLLESEDKLTDPKGVVYAKLRSSSFFIGAGGFGGPKGPKAGGGGAKSEPPKGREDKPDVVIEDKTDKGIAALYRLNGDYNPLHIDPAVSGQFGRPILHGLASMGHAARAILQSVGHYDPSCFTSLYARFASPVYPGDTLLTMIWVEEKKDMIEIIFVQKVKESGKICLANGKANLKRTSSSDAKI